MPDNMPHTIIVHCLDHASAALGVSVEQNCEVTLLSPPGAAAYMGATVFRDMIAAASQVIDSCFAAENAADEIIDAAEKTIFAIAEEQFRGGFLPLREIAGHAVDHLQNLAEGTDGITGVARLQRYPGGLTLLRVR